MDIVMLKVWKVLVVSFKKNENGSAGRQTES